MHAVYLQRELKRAHVQLLLPQMEDVLKACLGEGEGEGERVRVRVRVQLLLPQMEDMLRGSAQRTCSEDMLIRAHLQAAEEDWAQPVSEPRLGAGILALPACKGGIP